MENKINFLQSKGVDAQTAIDNMMGIEVYDEMLNDYYEALPKDFNNLLNYKNSGDMANYAILVHAMKSNARSFGFTKLGDVAYEHEMKSKESDINYVNENFETLQNEVQNVINIITEYKNI